MSIFSRIPFLKLRAPMMVAALLLWQALTVVVVTLDDNWFGEQQSEASRAREKQEVESRQAILRQCLEKGKETPESPSHTRYPAWHAVSPADGLTPAAPMKWLADDVVMAFAWNDTKPEDAAYEGFVTLFAPPERFVGLVPTQEARDDFAREDMYYSCWRKGHAVGPQGGKDVLQVFTVALVYDVPVFWFGQRLPRGGDAKTEASAMASGMATQFQPLVERFWLKHIGNEIMRAFTNPMLLLPALLIGWFFAQECAFAFLWAVLLSCVWTFLALCLDFAGYPVSVARPYELAAGANSVVCLTVVLLTAFLRRRFAGRTLEARLRAREDALIARLEEKRESLKHEEGSPIHEFHSRREAKYIAFVRNRGRRSFSYFMMGLLLLGALLYEGAQRQSRWENAYIREVKGVSYVKDVISNLVSKGSIRAR